MHFGTPSIIRDVVGDDVTGTLAVSAGFGSHGHLPEEEWRVLINLSCNIFGQQPRLELDTATIGGLVPKDRMFNFFIEPLFKLCKEHGALLLLEPVGSQFHHKISGRQHAMIHDAHHDRIHDAWPEFFQQVKS